MRKVLGLAIVVIGCLFVSASARAQDGSPECIKAKQDLAQDTLQAAPDCGKCLWDPEDVGACGMCVGGLVFVAMDQNDVMEACGVNIVGGPGGCRWWDVYCAAVNVWHGPAGPWDWIFGGGDPFGWVPPKYGPEPGPTPQQTANDKLKVCSSLFASHQLDYRGYVECTTVANAPPEGTD